MISSSCLIFTGIKLLFVFPFWAIVPFVFSYEMMTSPVEENLGDIVINCAAIGAFYI
jgi:hypothetical protein